MTWRGLWAGLWPGNWQGPTGDAPVVHPLGHVTLALVARTGLTANQLSLEGDDFESPFEGTGGPDDERLSPAVRKWIREKYKRDEQPQVVRGTVRAHIPDEDGSTPSPATIERDIAPLIESASQAARAALVEIDRVRNLAQIEENKRRAVALVLALLDD